MNAGWWSKKDKQILKEFWGKIPFEDLMKLFHDKRTDPAIKAKANRLGLPPPYFGYSGTEKESFVDEDFVKTLRKRIKI